MTAATVVFTVALLNGLAWSFLTPAFQVPDETAHFAYAQRLAESGVRAGDIRRPEFSSEQQETMDAIGTLAIIGRPLSRPPLDQLAAKSAETALGKSRQTAPRDDGGGPSTASAQPPLYYAIAAVVYRAFSWSSLLVRLHAMRVLSVVVFAAGAALCALLVAELITTNLGVVLAGGLTIALSPYTAFISSGVTPDTLLLSVSVALMLVLARASRRGLTSRRSAQIGLLLGAGAMTKLTFIAVIVPGLFAFLYLLIRKNQPLHVGKRRATRHIAWCAASGIALPLAFFIWLKITGRPIRPVGTSSMVLAAEQIKAFNLRESISYGWQLFFPPLPFMNDQFDDSPLTEIWIKGYAGRFGWLDYSAPAWLATWSVRAAALVAFLALAASVASRRAVSHRRAELAVAVMFFVSLAAVIAKAGYDYRRITGLVFEQPRYLFPLAGLFAVISAAACLGFGRRAIPYTVATLVAVVCLHNLAGLAVTVARYYG